MAADNTKDREQSSTQGMLRRIQQRDNVQQIIMENEKRMRQNASEPLRRSINEGWMTVNEDLFRSKRGRVTVPQQAVGEGVRHPVPPGRRWGTLTTVMSHEAEREITEILRALSDPDFPNAVLRDVLREKIDVNDLMQFNRDRQRVLEIMTKIRGGVDPVQQSLLISEAAKIAERYDEVFNISQLKYIPNPVDQARRIDQIMRRTKHYRQQQQAAMIVQSEVEKNLSILEDLLWVIKTDRGAGRKSRKVAEYEQWGIAERIAQSVVSAVWSGDTQKFTERMRMLQENLRYARARELQEVADAIASFQESFGRALSDPQKAEEAVRTIHKRLAEEISTRIFLIDVFKDEAYVMDTRVVDTLAEEAASLRARYMGFVDLALLNMKKRPDLMRAVAEALGLSPDAPDLEKLIREQLIQRMTEIRSKDAPADPVLRMLVQADLFPGGTRQQLLDIAASMAVHDPTNMPGRLQREIERAIRLRRIHLATQDVDPDLDPESIRQEARGVMQELEKARKRGGGRAMHDVLDKLGLSQYIAENRLNRQISWMLAQQQQMPVWVPGIGEVTVRRIFTDPAITGQSGRVLAVATRIWDDPRRVSLEATPEQWAKLITAATQRMSDVKSSKIPEEMSDLLSEIDERERALWRLLDIDTTRSQIRSNAAVVQDVSGAPRLIRAEDLGREARWAADEQIERAINTMLRAWTPWLAIESTPSGIPDENYINAFNAMWEATQRVVGDKLRDIREAERFAEIINAHYRPIMREFFEIMDETGGLDEYADRFLSALSKAGVSLDLNTFQDQATIYALWNRLKDNRELMRDMSFQDFQEALRVAASLKYHQIPLQDYFLPGEEAVSVGYDPYGAFKPDEMIDIDVASERQARERLTYELEDVLEGETNLVASNRPVRGRGLDVVGRFSQLRRKDKRTKQQLTEYEAVRRLIEEGATWEDLARLARERPSTIPALGQIMAEYQTTFMSAEDIRNILQLAEEAGVADEIRFRIHERPFIPDPNQGPKWTQRLPRVLYTGRARDLGTRGIEIAGLTFMTEAEQALNTFILDPDMVEAELRGRFGYQATASRVVGLEPGELPIVDLPGFERSILSGRAWRAANDPDAVMLNLRAIARGARAVSFDTEYMDLTRYPELSKVSQLLQIGYVDLQDPTQQGLINIQPSQQLEQFIESRFALYRRLQQEGRELTHMEIARALAGQGVDPALIAQRERDILNSLLFIARLHPDANIRELAGGALVFEFPQSRQIPVAIRNLDILEGAVRGALQHLRETGVPERQAIRQFMEVMRDAIGIGVNVSEADIRMLERAADSKKLRAVQEAIRNMPVVDLLTVARWLYPEGIAGRASWALASMVRLLPEDHPIRVEYEQSAHTALTDARAAAAVHETMMTEMRARGIDPAAIRARATRETYLVTRGIGDLDLGPGIYRIQEAQDTNVVYGLLVSRYDPTAGTFESPELIARPSRAEIIDRMTQYGILVDNIDSAREILEESTWRTESARLERVFTEGLFNLENLIDIRGERLKATQDALLNLANQPEGMPGSRLLQMPESVEHIQRLVRRRFTPRPTEAGEVLAEALKTPGGQALYESFIEAEAIARAARAIPDLTYDRARAQSREMLRSLVDEIKRRAGERQMLGVYRLPEIAIGEAVIPLTIDEYNPILSMQQNIQEISQYISAPLESERKAAAARTLHEHLLRHGLVRPLPENIHQPSVDVMALQVIQAVDRTQMAAAPDLYGFIRRLGEMTPEEAEALRTELRGVLYQHELGRSVEEHALARAERDLFMEAATDLFRRGQRIPLPLFASLPVEVEASNLLVDMRGIAYTPQEIIEEIDRLAAERGLIVRDINALSSRARFQPEYTQHLRALQAHRSDLDRTLINLTSIVRENLAKSEELRRYVGLDSVNADTMILAGSTQFLGRRVGSLLVSQVEDAIASLENSLSAENEAVKTVAAHLRTLNAMIKEKGMLAQPERTVGEVLYGRPPVVEEFVDLGERLSRARGRAEELMRSRAQQAIEDAQSVAQAAAQAREAAEYSFIEQLGRGFDAFTGHARRYALPVLAGTFLIGAFTLGGRELPRPTGDAPAPDGTYDEDWRRYADKPLPPDIIMGRHAYVEPEGTGLTVKLRTRGRHDPQQISTLIQSALGPANGQLHITVRDDRETLDRTWLREQIVSLL